MNILTMPAELRVIVRRSPQLIVAVSELPEPVRQLILRVVKRTRLWRREKAEVAEELVAHFEDGLSAGRAADELVRTFGDPALAAKLIRRGKKRNRSAWWQSLRYAVRGICWFVVLYVAASLLLALRAPRMSVDYVALLNSRLPSAPADQQAWPIYRAALLAQPLAALGEDNWEGTTDADGKVVAYAATELRPTDADWPRALKVLEKYRPLVDAARAAGLKPVFGLPLLPVREYGAEDRRAMGFSAIDSAAQPFADAAPAPRALHAVPWYTPWTLVDLLALDSWRAAEDGDAQRVVQNYAAMIGMARHARETAVLRTLSVAMRAANLANQTIAAIDRSYPKLLDGRRVTLLHAMAGAADLYDFDTSGERLFLLDVIQRTYSDNGRGNGTLTYDGIREVITASYRSIDRAPDDLPLEEKGLFVASLPAAAAIGASRRDVTQMVETYFDAAERERRRPLWERMRGASETERLADGWRASPSSLYGFRNLLLMVHLPQVEPTLLRCDEARALHEATMTALALSVWRERHGDYPASLGELVPRYLPKLPVDHSSGQPLHYKLVDGHPLLYGLGQDGVDHDGARGEKPHYWPYLPPPGADWVLYPPFRYELEVPATVEN